MTQPLLSKIIHKLALRLTATLADEATHAFLTTRREREAQEQDARAIFEAHVRRTCEECGGTGRTFRKWDDAPMECWACSPQPR